MLAKNTLIGYMAVIKIEKFNKSFIEEYTRDFIYFGYIFYCI